MKSLFFHDLEDGERLDSQIHPYFQDLIPLAKEWYLLMRSNYDPDPVHFDDMILMLDKHYNNLPKDEPSPELLFTKMSLKRKQPTLDVDDLGGARDVGELPCGATQRRLLVVTVPLAK